MRWREAERLLDLSLPEEALVIFLQLADEGYSEAYVEIGNILERRSKNETELILAKDWYLRAIREADDPYGNIGLARLALNGLLAAGTNVDAMNHLTIACNANIPIAQIILGVLYHRGEHVVGDLQKAEELYLSAIEHGYILPMVYLSKLKWRKGLYLSSVFWRLSAVIKSYKLAIANTKDPRLWNYLD